MARATVKGTLLIALVQGTLSGLTLWIFGVGSPFLWGVVATLLSIIPLVGAWLVLYPAAFIQIATGHVWQGVGILLVTVVVIVNVDNLLRPRLVGQEAGMHDLMVFFSTLGGIGMFGADGLHRRADDRRPLPLPARHLQRRVQDDLDDLGPPLDERRAIRLRPRAGDSAPRSEPGAPVVEPRGPGHGGSGSPGCQPG